MKVKIFKMTADFEKLEKDIEVFALSLIHI